MPGRPTTTCSNNTIGFPSRPPSHWRAGTARRRRTAGHQLALSQLTHGRPPRWLRRKLVSTMKPWPSAPGIWPTQEQSQTRPVGITASARERSLPLAMAAPDWLYLRGRHTHRDNYRGMGMAEIAAQGTEQGTILLTVTSDAGQRGQAELSADQADDLKAQLETALLAVRMRQIKAALASLPQTASPARRSLDAQPPRPKRRRLSRFFHRG
jgi:hypothetical protein